MAWDGWPEIVGLFLSPQKIKSPHLPHFYYKSSQCFNVSEPPPQVPLQHGAIWETCFSPFPKLHPRPSHYGYTKRRLFFRRWMDGWNIEAYVYIFYKICSSTMPVVTRIARLVVSQLVSYGECLVPSHLDRRQGFSDGHHTRIDGRDLHFFFPWCWLFQRELPSGINDHIAIAGSFPRFFHHFSMKEIHRLKVWVHFTAGYVSWSRRTWTFSEMCCFFGRASNPARDSSHNQVRLADKKKTGGFQMTPTRWWFWYGRYLMWMCFLMFLPL